MSNKYFTSDHEWLQIDGSNATIGITDYAQQSLGEIVYVELPEIGVEVNTGDSLATIESVKAASEVYAPIQGTILEVNEALNDEPELVNSDAENEGWFIKLSMAENTLPESLLSKTDYDTLVEQSE